MWTARIGRTDTRGPPCRWLRDGLLRHRQIRRTARGIIRWYEDVRGQQWIAIHGDPAVERKPVFEDGKPVYDGENVRTVSVESVRYKNTPSRFKEPEKRPDSGIKAPKRRK